MPSLRDELDRGDGIHDGGPGVGMKLPTCELCLQPIEPKDQRLVQVTGWLRPQGTGGGQVVKREHTGRYAHRTCVEHGIPEGRLW